MHDLLFILFICYLEFMKVEELKELSDRIRSEFRGRPRVSWPGSFKQIVVKELSNGKKVQDLSKATGINHQVIRNWQRKTQKTRKEKQQFKQITVNPLFRSSSPLTLISRTGFQIKGLCFPQLCELLKKGLL